MDPRLDIVVFGATGFTGKHVLTYLYKLSQNSERNLTWGIAGRSQDKLKRILVETSSRIGTDVTFIPIIVAETANENSITKMAESARIIINCCGPYQLHGEVVIKCCIKTGTHYVDVNAEPYFQDLMEAKYRNAAENRGVYIVNYCGFGYMASEIPFCLLEKAFPGTLNSVEIFTDSYHAKQSQGPHINYGSWESAVSGSSKLIHLTWLGIKRDWNSPRTRPKIRMRLPFTKDGSIGIPNKRIVPCPSPDSDVVKRSQLYFYENDRKRPIQVRHYYLMDSWKNILLIIFFGLLTIILSQCQCGRKLLLKYPKFFTGGYFDHESPTEELVESTEFDMYFYGKGWKETDEKDNQFTTPPNKSILGRLHVVNPGYGFTCLAVVLSAIMILTEPSNLPKKGGVYTPAAAFFKTSLVEEMQKNGVQLEILSVNDL